MTIRKIFQMGEGKVVGTADVGDKAGIVVKTDNPKLQKVIATLSKDGEFLVMTKTSNRWATWDDVTVSELESNINMMGFYVEGGWLDVCKKIKG